MDISLCHILQYLRMKNGEWGGEVFLIRVHMLLLVPTTNEIRKLCVRLECGLCNVVVTRRKVID